MSPLVLPPHILHPKRKLAPESLRLLWVCGTIGSGKSVQAFEIIKTMQQLCNKSTGRSFGFGYFYFDFNDAAYQKSNNMIRSLALQLGTRSPQAKRLLKRRLNNLYFAKQQPGPLILEVLEELIDFYEVTYIVLDALDECARWDELSDTIATIMDRTKAKVLLVSRDLPHIKANLKELGVDMRIVRVEGDGVNNDMRAYVQSKWGKSLRPLAKHLDKTPGRRADVEEELVRRAEGMFRWLELQLMSFGEAFCDTTNGKALDEMLGSLPKGLNETYKRILARVLPSNLEKAQRLLRWLCFSARPMTIREVAQAITIDDPKQTNKDMTFDEDGLPTYSCDILKYCPGILNTVLVAGKNRERLEEVSENDEVRLAHFSMKEYLQSNTIANRNFHIQEKATNIYQSRACLAFMDWMQTHLPVSESLVVRYPMATYSAQYWPVHARAAFLEEPSGNRNKRLKETMRQLQDKIKGLLGSETGLLTWITLFDPDHNESRYDSTVTDVLSPIYYASLCGLDYHIKQLLAQKSVDVDVSGGRLERPLRAACRYGFETSARHLIKKGARFPYDRGENEQDNKAEDEKVFADASISGNTSLMRFLLEREGATLTVVKPVTHVEAMYQAVNHGHFGMAKLLVRHDNVNSELAKDPGEPAKAARLLERATADGNSRMVRLLLSLGAEVNFQGGWYGTAIRAAALEGHEDITKELLNWGADPHLDGYSPGSAMTAAIDFDRFSVVDILLEHKGPNQFDANKSEDTYGYGNPLQLAASIGHVNVVQKLLNRGAQVDAVGGLFHTALQAACAEGHLEIVELLLEYGASPNIAGMNQTAETELPDEMHTFCKDLRLACMSGDPENIDRFLHAWTRASEKQESEGNYIAEEYHVSEEGYSRRRDWPSRVVCLRAPGEQFPSIMLVPWKTVGIRRHGWTRHVGDSTANDMVRFIGGLPQVTVQNGQYGSALRAAVIRKRTDIVKCLLNKGASVAMADGGASGSVLQLARAMSMRAENQEILTLLEEAAAKE